MADPDSDVASWVDAVANADGDIQRLQQDINGVQEEAAAALKKSQDMKAVLDQLTKEMDALAAEFFEADAFAQKVNQQRKQLQSKITLTNQRLETVRTKLEENQGQLNIKETALESLRKETEDYATREEAEEAYAMLPEAIYRAMPELKTGTSPINVEEHLVSPDGVELLQNIVHRRELHYKKRGGDASSVLKAQKSLLEISMQKGRTERARLHNLIRVQRKSMELRLRKYQDLFEHTAMMINADFASKLKHGRNWTGHIDIDAENELLAISVQPRTEKGNEVAAVTDLKSLSGGERSFTGVSFVLALGKEVETPFFAMDEFDVFLDAVNRKVALTSILKFANEMRDTQFILLSPLEMSVVEQARSEINDQIRRAAKKDSRETVQAALIEEDFIHTLAMAPPRDGARAHN